MAYLSRLLRILKIKKQKIEIMERIGPTITKIEFTNLCRKKIEDKQKTSILKAFNTDDPI